MTSAEALQEARGLAGANRVRIESHAWDRMAIRGAVRKDVVHALANGVSCKPGNKPGRWAITGPDVDGDDLLAVIVFEDGIVVVTMY